jgi:putative ABC transport system permease protein
MVRRPGRVILTGLGTTLGVASLVAVLGISETAQRQVSASFDRRRATEVIAEDASQQQDIVLFTDAGIARVRGLNGVIAAGRYRTVSDNAYVSQRPGERPRQVPLIEAEPNALTALDVVVANGRKFDGFHQNSDADVVLVGRAAARTLGIDRVDNQRAILVGDTPLTVLGIIEESRDPQLLLGVVTPLGTQLVGEVSNPMRAFIQTAPGAAQTIGEQVPLVLVPNNADAVKMIVPPDPRSLRREVETSVQSAFLVASAIALIVGIIGIMNATLVSVLQRTNEIGLRRALGARPRHIAALISTEAGATGLIGGVLGALLGLIAMTTWSIANNWTLILDPASLALAPALGATTGILAGLIPATRAARLQPTEALRR